MVLMQLRGMQETKEFDRALVNKSRARASRLGSTWPNNAIALQEPGSKLKGSLTDCALPGKTFIWLPFTGGISAFAVILPKPVGAVYEVGGGYPDASQVRAELSGDTTRARRALPRTPPMADS
jgi:hypothetical protein